MDQEPLTESLAGGRRGSGPGCGMWHRLQVTGSFPRSGTQTQWSWQLWASAWHWACAYAAGAHAVCGGWLCCRNHPNAAGDPCHHEGPG